MEGVVDPLLKKPFATVDVDGVAFIGLKRDEKMNRK